MGSEEMGTYRLEIKFEERLSLRKSELMKRGMGSGMMGTD
jgi:hypothetical protein